MSGALLSLDGTFSGNFGQVAPGSVITKIISVKNLGNLQATGLAFKLSNPAFAFTGGSAPGINGNCGSTLGPAASCSLEIVFVCPPSGLLSERLTAAFSDSNTPNQSWTLGLYGGARLSGQLRNVFQAQLDYDVVYVRCPRGQQNIPLTPTTNTGANWGGINDTWIEASNNIHQQPGCSLVLHHSALPPNDPGREEVIVPCDDTNAAVPNCSVIDPNVSTDGRYIIYAKFMDTRTFASSDFAGANGYELMNHYETSYTFSGTNAIVNNAGVTGYASPTYIFEYDLQTKTERQVSPSGVVHGQRANTAFSYQPVTPVMDTGPAYLPDGDIVFTSNRENGYTGFQLYRMDRNGQNLRLLGTRAMSHQLHPFLLDDGRIIYTSHDIGFGHTYNNKYSLFQEYPDGSFPFIFAGKLDSTMMTYHYATQLTDGDVVSTIYYNNNNMGTGSFIRFPAVNPNGPQFAHSADLRDFIPLLLSAGQWVFGSTILPFAKPGQIWLTPNAPPGDGSTTPYASQDQFYMPDGRLIINGGKFSHPSGAPNNAVLATYAIGSGTTDGNASDPNGNFVGRDGGIWLLPLEPRSQRKIGHIADDAVLVVDTPNYQEIMPRAVVPYYKIHGKKTPDIKIEQTDDGTIDPRLAAGEPFALTGASSLIDRETASLNGLPWNIVDGGGWMSGRTYSNLASQGADLAIYANSEIYGIRVLLPIPEYPDGNYGGNYGLSINHQLRILGEFPVRDANGTLVDLQGNPDTSFIVKVPAETPFSFQAIDKNGMALNIENVPRSAVAGEKQTCVGCHVHTRSGIATNLAPAISRGSFAFGDFTGISAPLFRGINPTTGNVQVALAKDIYPNDLRFQTRRSFAVDFNHEIGPIFQNRCVSCHGVGQSAQVSTGLRLDGTFQTFQLLQQNSYTDASGTTVNGPTAIHECCLTSRWHSKFSARSSMIIWALYGKRLDGRDPTTGLPPAGSGIPVDNVSRENPDVWPTVANHLNYLSGMPEDEKRMIARWIDIGGPLDFVAENFMRPVITITPVGSGSSITQILVGLWGDSPLDYSTFLVLLNGQNIAPPISGTPTVVTVPLPQAVTKSNAAGLSFSVQIDDNPGQTFGSSTKATQKNRQIKSFSGTELLRKLNML